MRSSVFCLHVSTILVHRGAPRARHPIAQHGRVVVYRWENAGLVWNGKWQQKKNRKRGKKWKNKWKTAPSRTGAKMAKQWPENGEQMENFLENPFSGNFLAIFDPIQLWGLSSIWFSNFPHFRLLAIFHSIQAPHDPKSVSWCTPSLFGVIQTAMGPTKHPPPKILQEKSSSFVAP